MLYDASIDEVRRGTLTRAEGTLAICMRHYPRGLKRSLVDEYFAALAPDEQLFADFRRELLRTGDHEAAFQSAHYEARFTLAPAGLANLEQLAEISRRQPTYLICQCKRNERCHRHLLMLLAQKLFAARINPVRLQYPIFAQRLALMSV